MAFLAILMIGTNGEIDLDGAAIEDHRLASIDRATRFGEFASGDHAIVVGKDFRTPERAVAVAATSGRCFASVGLMTREQYERYCSHRLLPLDTKPRYVHDCTACVFLGRCKRYDLYYCGREFTRGSTIVARYGSDGPDYMSGITFAQWNDVIREGVRRAIARGLLSPTAEHCNVCAMIGAPCPLHE